MSSGSDPPRAAGLMAASWRCGGARAGRVLRNERAYIELLLALLLLSLLLLLLEKQALRIVLLHRSGGQAQEGRHFG